MPHCILGSPTNGQQPSVINGSNNSAPLSVSAIWCRSRTRASGLTSSCSLSLFQSLPGRPTVADWLMRKCASWLLYCDRGEDLHGAEIKNQIGNPSRMRQWHQQLRAELRSCDLPVCMRDVDRYSPSVTLDSLYHLKTTHPYHNEDTSPHPGYVLLSSAWLPSFNLPQPRLTALCNRGICPPLSAPRLPRPSPPLPFLASRLRQISPLHRVSLSHTPLLLHYWHNTSAGL